MERDLKDLRKSYEKFELTESNISDNPYHLFDEWFEEAKGSDSVDEANAMSLTTISEDGFPKNRIVLLKEIIDGSFVFYSNYESEKGNAIAKNSKVCLHFFWPGLERQVTIKGIATKVDRSISEAYYHSRPRGSQIGAWASKQSSVVEGRASLDDALKYYEEKFEGHQIPLPDHWGGYAVQPYSIEFWQGRPNRMHDRILFENKSKSSWTSKRLAP